MNGKTFAAAIAASAMLAGFGATTASAQGVPAGTVWAVHSPATASCPALEWHLVAAEGGVINGMVSWNGMKSMAQVTGTVDASRNVSMTAKEQGGEGKTATITGHGTGSGQLVLNIDGPGISCKSVTIRTYRTLGTKAG
jgi:hypothetical protein